MALIENGNSSFAIHGVVAGAWQGFIRRREQRHLNAELAGKAARLLQDIGVDPAAFPSRPWAYELGGVQAIGNRP